MLPAEGVLLSVSVGAINASVLECRASFIHVSLKAHDVRFDQGTRRGL